MDSMVRVIFLGDSASAVRSVTGLQGKMGGLESSMRNLKRAGAVVFAGIATSIFVAEKAAIGFDRSMRNVNSIAHLNEKQLKKLENQVLALGKVSGQAPKVLADGLYDIVSSGKSASDAIKILHVSAIAATAGMTDTATASKAVVAVLNAYKMPADQARHVSSLLFKEVQLGVNTFGELAQNIGDTVPAASSLKVPFSQVAAGLALITLHGTSMAEASTQMSRVLTDILKPSKSLSAEFKKLGYENGQAAIQAHGFIPLINQLSNAAGGPSGAAVQTATWFGNIRSLRGMLNLTGPNLKKFNEFADEMAKSFKRGGDDVKAFNEQSKSIAVQWDKATSSLTASSIKLGTEMFPILATGITKLADFGGWLDKLAQKPTIHAKVDFAIAAGESVAKSAQKMVDDVLFAHRAQRVGPVHAEGQITGGDLKFSPGLVPQVQRTLEGINWKPVGASIGAAIGSSIIVSAGWLDNLLKAVNSHSSQIADVGALIAVKIVSKLLDPAFWAHHWEIAVGIALAVFPVGRVAKLGEFFAESAFKLFGKTAGRAVLAGLSRLPGVVGEQAPRFAAAMGRFIVAAAGEVTSSAIKLTNFLISGVSRGFGRLGPLVKTLLNTYVVYQIEGAVHAAYDAALDLGRRIADGVISGIGNIGARVANKLTFGAFGGGGGAGSGQVAKSGGNFKAHAKAMGDKIDKPMLSWIGEDAPRWPEWVIPSNPAYRDRALGLMAQAQGALGIPGFAKGGGPGTGHHYTGHQLRKRSSVKTAGVVGAAKSAINALTAAQQTVSDLSRTYDQDQREQGTVTLPPFTVDVPDDPNDPTAGTHQVINQAGIDARVAQLNALVGEKNGILKALETERQKIEDAVAAVQKAIQDLLDAIKTLQANAKESGATARQEHGLAATASASVSRKGGLQDQVTKERAAKKPNQGRIHQLEGAIRQAGRDHDLHEGRAKTAETDQGRYQKQAEDKASQVKDLRGTLADLFTQRHDQPFDVRDVQIDIEALQQEIAQDNGTTVTPFTPSSSSTPSGGGSPSAVGIADDLLAELMRYREEAALEGAQLQVLGSFAKGTIYVPQTGLALLHAGESVVTRDQTAARAGGDWGGSLPALHIEGVALTDQFDAWYDGPGGQRIAADVISVMGASADRLRRENRLG